MFQRFLALLFTQAAGEWVLKGGAGLLIRLPDARYSQDLDLLRRGGASARQAAEELRQLTRPRPGELLNFVVGEIVTTSRTNPVVQLKVTANIGATAYDTFTIDLAHELRLTGTPDRVRPAPVVQMPGLPELPEIVLYPLADQIADKVCAMYERHGTLGAPSSRYRDLHDLVLMIATSDLDASQLKTALAAESQRRDLALPDRMLPPAEQWHAGYRTLAARTRLEPRYRDLDEALAFVGACLNPILDGRRQTGTWQRSIWMD